MFNIRVKFNNVGLRFSTSFHFDNTLSSIFEKNMQKTSAKLNIYDKNSQLTARRVIYQVRTVSDIWFPIKSSQN